MLFVCSDKALLGNSQGDAVGKCWHPTTVTTGDPASLSCTHVFSYIVLQQTFAGFFVCSDGHCQVTRSVSIAVVIITDAHA